MPQTIEQPPGQISVYDSYEYAAIIVGSGCSRESDAGAGIEWTRGTHPLFKTAPVYTASFQGGELLLKNTRSGKNTTVADMVGSGNALVAILGGDGTVASFGQEMAIAEDGFGTKPENRSALIAEGYGNGNVLQIILNGAKGVRKPPQLLRPELAEAQRIPLMEIVINGVKHYATLGFGLGALGRGARDINSESHRRAFGYKNEVLRTLIHEFRLGIKLSEKVNDGDIWVYYTQEGDSDGTKPVVKRAVSLDWANGPLLAKHIVLPGFSLSDQELRRIELQDPMQLPYWAYGVQMDEWQTYAVTADQEDSIILAEGTDAHINGNHMVIEKDSTVTVSVSSLGFMAIANKDARIKKPRIPITPIVTAAVTTMPTPRQIARALNPFSW
jgi:hypothetical protein